MSKIIDSVMKFLYNIAVIAIGWLPESPFANIDVEFKKFKEIMGMINYFVPIGKMLSILSTYLLCVLAWYSARWVLRLTKYID